MGQPQVGVQLIIFGERAQRDLPGVLAEVAAVGYDGFESGAPASAADADRIRAAMEGKSLGYVGGHCGEDQVKDAALLKSMADNVKALGGSFVVCSGGFNWRTLDDCRQAAASLAEGGKVCRDAGLSLCYHNHYWEFKEIEGVKPIHFIAEQTDPELLKLCPDIYWVQVGGEDPAEFITRYGSRSPCLHFKDGLGGDQMREFRELGKGSVDLRAALDAALAFDPGWIITEQDTTTIDPGDSAWMSRDYLKTLGL